VEHGQYQALSRPGLEPAAANASGPPDRRNAGKWAPARRRRRSGRGRGAGEPARQAPAAAARDGERNLAEGCGANANIPSLP
jgi:hypothetical protein